MAINSINGCIGCGTCVKTCPTDVIRLNSNGKAEIKYPAIARFVICARCIARLMPLPLHLKNQFQSLYHGDK